MGVVDESEGGASAEAAALTVLGLQGGPGCRGDTAPSIVPAQIVAVIDEPDSQTDSIIAGAEGGGSLVTGADYTQGEVVGLTDTAASFEGFPIQQRMRVRRIAITATLIILIAAIGAH
eukprot:SAG11_NODE_2178_length_3714_cov_4.224343_3_plen_118_part_00